MADLRDKRALITGASSGIGAAIARQLADRGVHLVLTARRKDQLDAVAAECRAEGVRVDVITADLGLPGSAPNLWKTATASGAVDICVNNAGFGYFRPFTSVEAGRDIELLQLNVISLVELSKLFCASRAGQPGRSYLLNVASTAAFQSIPNFAVYASSKAFVRNFTEALSAEYAGTPLSVTCLCPGGTHTEFHQQAGAGDYGALANASMLTAETCARIGLSAMERGKRLVVSGWINKLQCFGVRFVPRAFSTWMSRRVLGSPKREQLPARTVTP